MYISGKLAALFAIPSILSAVLASPLPDAEPEALPLPDPQNEVSAAGIPGVNITNTNIAGTAAVIKGSYIIVYKNDAPDSALDKYEGEITKKLGGKGVKAKYRVKSASGSPGFAAVQVQTDKKGLESIAKDPLVAFVELDAVSSVAPILVNQTESGDGQTSVSGLVHKPTTYWGLARISHRQRGFWTYVRDDSACVGTRIYVLDTGIRRTHKEFRSTASNTLWPFSTIRAQYGANFIAGEPNADQHGHGTHCAATAVGFGAGVCPRATVYSVKVIAANGFGSLSGLISGLQWAANHAITTNYRTKSVISVSVGAGYSAAVNAAVQAVYNAGIPVVVAAGNSNLNAWNESPASAPNAITVGATDINDQRASFSNWGSNYGTALDVFGPGVSVRSAYHLSDTSYAFMSGTSQATPHVAGIAAYLISKDKTTGAANLRTQIVNLATTGKVLDPKGSANRLAYNGNGF